LWEDRNGRRMRNNGRHGKSGIERKNSVVRQDAKWDSQAF
jgi:hypothetical protein